MFMVKWVGSIFGYLFPFFHNKKGTLLFLGLDNAGKTTLFVRLREDRMVMPVPTGQPSSESLKYGGVNFTTYDLGGHRQVRRIWKDYFPAADGIVFMLDSTDRDRFEEAKVELGALLRDENTQNCPVAILANKIDDQRAVGEEDLKAIFGLFGYTTGKDARKREELTGRPLEIFMCSVWHKQGYGNALRWLASYMD